MKTARKLSEATQARIQDNMLKLDWEPTAREHNLIMELAMHVHAIAMKNHVVYSLHDALMDITCVHLNGCALDLKAMVEAIDTEHDADVIHDLFGIRRHIDRTTGRLMGCFVPRYAKAEITA